VTTNHGTTSWSVPARLEAGLLDRADWQARFIASKEPESDEAGPAPMFRKAFDVDRPVRSARMYVSALGLFEVSTNGRRVGADVFAPDWTSYGHRIPYYTYDVTDLVQRGANAVSAVVGNGWYRGGIGVFPTRSTYGDRLALLAQIEITTTAGERIVVGTDGSWGSSTGEIRYDDIYNGCVVDLRSEQAGWTAATFDTPWSSVEELHGDHLERVYANDAPPVRVTEVRSVATRWSSPDGGTILDLGQNMVGWLRMSVRGGRSGDTGEGVAIAADGTVLLAGNTNSFGAGSDDAFLLRLRANGRRIDASLFGGAAIDHANDVAVGAGGTVHLGGSVQTPPWVFQAGPARTSRLRGTVSTPTTPLTPAAGTTADPGGTVATPTGSTTYAGSDDAALLRIGG